MQHSQSSRRLNKMRGNRGNTISLQTILTPVWIGCQASQKGRTLRCCRFTRSIPCICEYYWLILFGAREIAIREAMASLSFMITSPSSFSSNWTLWPDTPSTWTRQFFEEATVCGGGMVNVLMRPTEESLSSNDVFNTASLYHRRKGGNKLVSMRLKTKTAKHTILFSLNPYGQCIWARLTRR